ncbi:LlaJI family restriction endonuclease [Sporanaerobacter acetigenes]|uniref:LlaJI restriction endonuclease n=1 Tax=Sporanaerobacter acetigenes DSM 13106 TaxID=1123281 RepID=A0A1M5YZR7_9FIRM|nr:LlaJI family restriction endonuclease [Sporanaerobacter acetigenes]SHI17517.1 LlaJI restriction endonuclease [Sporanaerobacter acetigenes DSM 13106]
MSNEFKEVTLSKPLSEYCRNATNREGDTFVGIKSEIIGDKHEVNVYFPIGYKISEKEEDVRDEILDLISVLQAYNDKQSRVSQITADQVLKTVRFPVQAYFRVIHYYLQNDYYKENEEVYVPGTSGPVNMRETINKIQPIVQKSGFVFPNLMVRKNSDTDKHLITEINKYCVYESFIKMGWIYHFKLPQPAEVKNPNLKVYKSVLQQKLENANNDTLKQLFQSMLAIIDFRNSADDPEEFYFGTNNFEYIWEKLIDETYGIKEKDYYFPRTTWRLDFGERHNPALEPDSIMVTNEHICVLDAKYYKYGHSGKPSDLPRSTSINKQITYAEYIAENSKFEKERGEGKDVLNAFLMPFSKANNIFGTSDNYFSIGEAVAGWKHSTRDYERVQGILVDVKTLIANSTRPNRQEIKNLSKAIEESLKKNKDMESER